MVSARQRARDVAELLGFDRLEQTRIATAVSELARNAHRYAGGGEVRISCGPDRIQVEVRDEGPGIPNLEEILRGEYTSQTGLGRGLIGVRQLMDEFEITAPAERGTRVIVAKRLPARRARARARGRCATSCCGAARAARSTRSRARTRSCCRPSARCARARRR